MNKFCFTKIIIMMHCRLGDPNYYYYDYEDVGVAWGRGYTFEQHYSELAKP
jgi:hypothetical protein